MVVQKNDLPNITFIIKDEVGGIAYMNHQIIQYGKLMEYFNVRIILIKNEEDRTERFKDKFKAHETVYFNFSQFENYYIVLKKFSKIINNKIGIVVTNDGFELEAIKLFGTDSLIYSIVHDFYNLKLAVYNYSLTNVFMCHTETYTKALKSSGSSIPRVDYLPHGVKIDKYSNGSNYDKPLTLLFIGRFVESKGITVLYEINRQLTKKNIYVNWKIIGSGDLEKFVHEQWGKSENVVFLKPEDNKEVLEIAQTCDLFVSPSIFEGYGIALLEAMSCGLVPVVYDLPIGISSLLTSEVGFRIINENGSIKLFAEKIQLLNEDRHLLETMKKNAYHFVALHYNIIKTSEAYLKSFLNTELLKPALIIQHNGTTSFGIFDKKFLPNSIVKQLKKARSYIKAKTTNSI